jgi:flagellar hook-basal body complex protein FliE
MTKHLSIVAAAALAVAGMGYSLHAQDAPADNQPNAVERAADKTGDALNRAADRTGDAISNTADKTRDALRDAGPGNNKEEIHDVLAQVAEAAMNKDALDDMVERFVDADRNRLGQNKAALDDDNLDARVAQLRDDWKAKYNAEFDIKDEDALYGQGFAMITEGEIPEGARTAGERVSGDATTAGPGASAAGNVGDVSGSATVNPDTGRADVNVDNKTGVDAPKTNTDGQTAADTNRNDPGRNIASVKIAASHGMPELTVPMIHEAGGWKIDIPDSVDSAKLRDNVSNALAKCQENKDKWPADANESYRAVTHKVLLAIFDKPLMDEAQKASGTEGATPQPAASPQ